MNPAMLASSSRNCWFSEMRALIPVVSRSSCTSLLDSKISTFSAKESQLAFPPLSAPTAHLELEFFDVLLLPLPELALSDPVCSNAPKMSRRPFRPSQRLRGRTLLLPRVDVLDRLFALPTAAACRCLHRSLVVRVRLQVAETSRQLAPRSCAAKALTKSS